MTSASPWSILVFSGRYHIISNASKVINCIITNTLGTWPIWTLKSQLSGFMKRSTIHCYTQNIKALGFVVSSSKPRVLSPLRSLYLSNKVDIVPMACKDVVSVFSLCRYMKPNDPRVGLIYPKICSCICSNYKPLPDNEAPGRGLFG